MSKTNIIKVRIKSSFSYTGNGAAERTVPHGLGIDPSDLAAREYTYYTVDRLEVGDIIEVPVKNTTIKATVSAVDVLESEISKFKDKVKTIPAKTDGIPESLKDMLDADFVKEFKEERDGRPPLEKTWPTPEIQTAIINIKPEENSVVTDLYNEAVRLRKYADKVVITGPDDMTRVTNDLSMIKGLTEGLKSQKAIYLDPVNKQRKAMLDTFQTFMSPLEEADKIIRDKMVAHNLKLKLIQEKQEEINRKRMEAAKEEMELKGELSESVNLVEVTTPPKATKTDLGTASMKANWKYRVIDFSLLPDEYKIEDSVLLGSIARNHHDTKKIDGIEFYNDPGISIRRK